MNDWSEDRVNSLKLLWADGLSASQVARQLGGVTRNAVIGKVHRLGLSGRAPGGAVRCPRRDPRPPRAPTPRAPRPSAVAPSRVKFSAIVPPAEGPGLVGSIECLGGRACKWPIGDPKSDGFSFCGRSAAVGGPYCVGHAGVAYLPGKARSLDKDPVIRRALAGRL